MKKHDEYKEQPIPDLTSAQIKRSAALVLGGTLVAFFGIQAMGMIIEPKYKEGVINALFGNPKEDKQEPAPKF